MTTAEEQTSGFTVTHVRQACKHKLSCNRDQSSSRISFSKLLLWAKDHRVTQPSSVMSVGKDTLFTVTHVGCGWNPIALAALSLKSSLAPCAP